MEISHVLSFQRHTRVTEVDVANDTFSPIVNGIATTRLEPPSESSSSEEQEHAAEERRLLCEQLSKMPVPKVNVFMSFLT